jgi:hypothetical protein
MSTVRPLRRLRWPRDHLFVESSDKTLPVFNLSQLKVVHTSLLTLACNVSLYLALDFLVENE